MKNEKRWNLLEKVAVAAEPVSRSRMAAMLVYKNDVIAVGYNKKKSHPLAQRFQKHKEAIYLHAEIDCIKNALRVVEPELLQKCTMYILRVKRPDHNPKGFMRAMAKPCCGCDHAIEQFGIKNVYYTTDEGIDVL